MMNDSFWADMYEHAGLCNDDYHIYKLLIELRYLIENEKTIKAETKAGAASTGDEAP